ncbi:MAG TPA: hypothetical protein VKI65_00210, partial [Gemmataceae bacterium]|nr:hypothetical protein [Gemmataceae bacterium]
MLNFLRQLKRRYLDKPMHFLRVYRAADAARRRRLKAVFRRYWPLPKWRPWRRRGIWLYCDYPFLQERLIARFTGAVEFRGWAVATGGIASVTLSCDGQLLSEATYGCRRPDVVRLGIPRAY